MQPELHIWVNGIKSDSIPANDRGLMYGDGLFETIAVKQGRPQLWDSHIQRLVEGCERLQIELPVIAQLQSEALQLCSQYPQSVLKIIITRGAGRRGYRPDSHASPTRILYCSDLPLYPEQWYIHGIQATVCKTRLGINRTLAGIKHLNRLEQVMARSEWNDEFSEGLMLDVNDRVIEGTMSNVFIIRDGRLCTPSLNECGVSGIMRSHILEMAGELAIPAVIGDLSLQDVLQADSVFFCNSLLGIWPVHQLNATTYARHSQIDILTSAIDMDVEHD